MSNNSLPIHGINQSQRNMRDSISRLVTGIKVLGGNDVAEKAILDPHERKRSEKSGAAA